MHFPLCTFLPILPPQGIQSTFVFRNAHRTTTVHEGILAIHQDFSAEGLPYTCQAQHALPEDQWELDLEPDDGSECLTASERNSFMRP